MTKLTAAQKVQMINEAYEYQKRLYREANPGVKVEYLKARNKIATYATSYDVSKLAPQKFAELINRFHETIEIISVDIDFKIKNWET